MARTDADEPVVMSIFDRLLDHDPSSKQEVRKPRGKALGELRDALRRDLEALLNARPCSTTWPPFLSELDSSILNYGVTTITSADLSTDDNRERFRAAVERTIRRFEPRFLRVSVHLIDDPERLDRTLRFRIEALVNAKPAPEPIVFDSVLDPSTQGVTVLAPRDV
jgi:type VI secretion system protein ImpF